MSYVFRSARITPRCMNCGLPSCKCHAPREEREQLEKALVDDAPIVLGTVAPLATDGLVVEGIATTRDWNAREFPFAAGLTALDGRKGSMRGLDPAKMVVKLPLPCYWRHDETKRLGEMFAASATDLALFFRAIIVRPGTAGFDADLLEQVWRDVRSGAVAAVSFSSYAPNRDGSFWGRELSITPKGGNAFAQITRAVFPDAHVVERPAPRFDLEAAQRAWLSFAAKAASIEKAAPRDVALQSLEQRLERLENESMRDAGIWKSGISYGRGSVVNHKSALWVCKRPTTDAPPGDCWRLIVKSPR